MKGKIFLQKSEGRLNLMRWSWTKTTWTRVLSIEQIMATYTSTSAVQQYIPGKGFTNCDFLSGRSKKYTTIIEWYGDNI